MWSRKHSASRCSHADSRQGVVAVLVAVSLIVLLGVVAFSLDGGVLLDKRRQLQATAEASATAAALELYRNFAKDKGLDIDGSALANALEIALGNGFANDGDNSIVTVNIPPTSGEFVGQPGYVEVYVQFNYKRSFSTVFGGDPIPVRARAVAAGAYTPTKASILVLDPKKKNSLRLDKASVTVKGDIIVNSKSKSAIELKKESQITADNVIVSGKIKKKNKDNVTVEGEIFTGADPTPDPLADLPAPKPGPSRNKEDYHTKQDGVDYYTLKPGTYGEELKFDDNDVVVMEPGIYYIEDGGFSIKKHASLEAYEVMIYNASKKDLKFESDASIILTPPSGGTYAGVTLFQNRKDKGKIKFKKDADLQITGTVYAPNGEVRFQQVDEEIGGFLDDDGGDDDGGDDGGDDDDGDDDDGDDDDGGDDDGGDDDGGDDDFVTSGRIGAQIIARTLKIDKHSNVVITGDNVVAQKPFVGLVE